MKKILYTISIFISFYNFSIAQTGFISGYVYKVDSPSVMVNSGKLIVYKDTGGYGYLAVDSGLISGGSYALFNLDTSNKLMILAIPDSVSYPNLIPTYADSSVMWHEARTFLLNSAVFNSASSDIYINSKLPSLSGNNIVSGRMRDNSCNCTGKVQGPGDPFNGIDVSLIDKSTGSAMAVTITDNDTTPWLGGKFTIDSVPDGEYFLYCDLAGIIIDTTWSFVIGGGSNRFFEVIVESDHMWYKETTSIEDITNNLLAFEVYPNPVTSSINISYELEERADVIISLFDVLGQKSVDLLTKQKGKGKYMDALDISQLHLSKGTYFIKMKVGNTISAKQIIINN